MNYFIQSLNPYNMIEKHIVKLQHTKKNYTKKKSGIPFSSLLIQKFFKDASPSLD